MQTNDDQPFLSISVSPRAPFKIDNAPSTTNMSLELLAYVHRPPWVTIFGAELTFNDDEWSVTYKVVGWSESKCMLELQRTGMKKRDNAGKGE